MTITLNGTTGITSDGGYTGDGVSFADGTPSNTLVTNTSGKVSIGTAAAPSGSSMQMVVNSTGSSGGGGIEACYNNNGGFATDALSGGGQRFFTFTGSVGSESYTERMRIDSSGNLLVGTTSQYGVEKFNVTTANSSSNRGICNFFNSSATSTTKIANRLIRLAANASGADNCIEFTDNVSNNYYFGGNNGGAYVMANSNGVRLSNGGTSWASDSDERVKDIIEPITDAANKVSTLRAVIGKYKTDEEGTRRSFLIAQDVQAVLPEAVVAQEDEIGTLSLAYTDTIPLLVAAIQEQQAMIETLKAKVEALEQANGS
jgi:hypothetical protein